MTSLISLVVALRANCTKELLVSVGDLSNWNCSADEFELIPDTNFPLAQDRENSLPIFPCHCKALAEKKMRKTEGPKLPSKRINVYPGRNDHWRGSISLV